MTAGHPTAVPAHYAPRARGPTSFRLQMFSTDVLTGFAHTAMNKIYPAKGAGSARGMWIDAVSSITRDCQRLKKLFSTAEEGCAEWAQGEFTSTCQQRGVALRIPDILLPFLLRSQRLHRQLMEVVPRALRAERKW
jgi:hypothetical protein